MSSGDPPVSFVVDYELSRADLREWIAADRPARRGRIYAAVWMAVTLVLALWLTVEWPAMAHGLVSCVKEPTPQSPPVQVWRCPPGSSGALLGTRAVLVAAFMVLWIIGVGYARSFWLAMPKDRARRWMAAPGVAGRYRAEVSTAGITSVSPSGTTTFTPWSVVGSVLETNESFFLLGPRARVRILLPKRGLSEPASVPLLGDYLRTSATGSSQPS